ncbi:MAG: hypothetical protein NT040_08080 [Bacteroidetes bacterium]|nr:hypothetical protein [Bacteroidota bacterium]
MRRLLILALAILLQVAGNGQTISRIEYFFDTDPGYGSATPVSYMAGSSVTATFNINPSGLSKGIHNLLIRAKNVNGKWSTVNWAPVYIMDPGPGIPVVSLEYFIDNDPGFGSATQVPVMPGLLVPAWFQANTAGLSTGMHYICVRAKDNNSRWSVLSSSMFFVKDIEANISLLEYYVDTDPGFGSGIPLTFTAGSKISASFSINQTGLAEGLHYVCVRAKDAQSRWSVLTSSLFVAGDIQTSTNLGKLEYFVDTDPGFGSGTPVAFTPGSKISASFALSPGSTAPGMHYVCLRAMDVNRRWSVLSWYPFVGLPAVVNADITGLEYFIDTDPGFGSGLQVPVTPGNNVNAVFSPSTATLAEGVHSLCVRAKNRAGTWSNLQQYVFSKVPEIRHNMTRLEYFIDADPGFGSGHPVNITPSNSVAAQFSPDTTGLPPGTRLLVVRVKDAAGNWSIMHDTTFNYSSTSRTWTGVVSDDWKVAGNWLPDGIPGWNDDVLIPPSAPNMPVVRNPGLSCRKIVVSPGGGALHISPGIVLTVNGDLNLD